MVLIAPTSHPLGSQAENKLTLIPPATTVLASFTARLMREAGATRGKYKSIGFSFRKLHRPLKWSNILSIPAVVGY